MRTSFRGTRLMRAALLTLTAAWMIPGAATAQRQIHDIAHKPDGPVNWGGWGTNSVGTEFQIAIEGFTVVVREDTGPGMPAIETEYDLQYKPVAALVQNDKVVIVTAGGTVYLYQQGGSTETPVGVFSTATMVDGAAISGNYLYVHGYNGVETLDLTDCAAPVSLGLAPYYGLIDLCATGNALYGVDGANVVKATLAGTTSIPLPGAGSVDVDADVGLVAVRENQNIDLFDEDLNHVHTIQLPDHAVDVSIRGDQVAAFTQQGDMLIYDITDPFTPFLLTFLSVQNPASPIFLGKIELSDTGKALISQGTRCYVYDPTAGTAEVWRFGDVSRSLTIAAGIFLASNGGEGGLALDDNPGLPLPGFPENPFLDGFECADISSWDAGVPRAGGSGRGAARIPGPPVAAPEPPDAFALAATGQGTAVLEIVRGRPAPIGFHPGGNVLQVATAWGPAGQRLALSLEATKLDILDLTDPAAPALASSVPVANALAVDVEGTLVVVSGTPSRLFDIADPTSPVTIGPPPVGGFGTTLDAGRIYGGSSRFFYAGDVSDPTAPSLLGSLQLSNPADIRGVTIEHQADGSVWAWIAAGPLGVVIADVTDPVNMTVVASYDTPDFAWDVLLHRGFAWVADGASGLWQLEVTGGPAPRLQPASGATAIAGAGPALGGLELAAFPNPSRGAATVSFTLPQAGVAAIAVYDVAGRRLARVADGELAAGRHSVTWDGRDASGRPVAAGVYLLRLEAGGVAETRRVVRLD
jgi:hypothetical protein